MATCAGIIQKKLPDNAAEDSYDLMPLLTNKGTYQRKYLIMHSGDGNFAIRHGKWKLEFCGGSGGWGYPTQELAKELKLPSLQLYDVRNDIGETKNLEDKYPDMIKSLTNQTKRIINNGRSTPGNFQKNDAEIILFKQ